MKRIDVLRVVGLGFLFAGGVALATPPAIAQTNVSGTAAEAAKKKAAEEAAKKKAAEEAAKKAAASPVYTFAPTPSGTVEVFKNGQRIATGTPAFAATNYGYNPAPSVPPVVKATPVVPISPPAKTRPVVTPQKAQVATPAPQPQQQPPTNDAARKAAEEAAKKKAAEDAAKKTAEEAAKKAQQAIVPSAQDLALQLNAAMAKSGIAPESRLGFAPSASAPGTVDVFKNGQVVGKVSAQDVTKFGNGPVKVVSSLVAGNAAAAAPATPAPKIIQPIPPATVAKTPVTVPVAPPSAMVQPGLPAPTRQVTLPNGAVVTINDKGDIVAGDPTKGDPARAAASGLQAPVQIPTPPKPTVFEATPLTVVGKPPVTVTSTSTPSTIQSTPPAAQTPGATPSLTKQVTLPNGAVVTINDKGDIVAGDPTKGNPAVAAASGLQTPVTTPTPPKPTVFEATPLAAVGKPPVTTPSTQAPSTVQPAPKASPTPTAAPSPTRQMTLPNGAIVTVNDKGDIVAGDPTKGNPTVAASSGLQVPVRPTVSTAPATLATPESAGTIPVKSAMTTVPPTTSTRQTPPATQPPPDQIRKQIDTSRAEETAKQNSNQNPSGKIAVVTSSTTTGSAAATSTTSTSMSGALTNKAAPGGTQPPGLTPVTGTAGTTPMTPSQRVNEQGQIRPEDAAARSQEEASLGKAGANNNAASTLQVVSSTNGSWTTRRPEYAQGADLRNQEGWNSAWGYDEKRPAGERFVPNVRTPFAPIDTMTVVINGVEKKVSAYANVDANGNKVDGPFQCTALVSQYLSALGFDKAPKTMPNGRDVAATLGTGPNKEFFEFSNLAPPKAGSIVSMEAGVGGKPDGVGHVAIVKAVEQKGDVVIATVIEQNIGSNGQFAVNRTIEFKQGSDGVWSAKHQIVQGGHSYEVRNWATPIKLPSAGG